MAAERFRIVMPDGINVEFLRTLDEYPRGLKVRILHGLFVPDVELFFRDQITDFDRASSLYYEGLRDYHYSDTLEVESRWVEWEHRCIPCGQNVIYVERCSLHPIALETEYRHTHGVTIDVYGPGVDDALFSMSIYGRIDPETQKMSYVRSIIEDPHHWLPEKQYA